MSKKSRRVSFCIGADAAGYYDGHVDVPGDVADINAWLIEHAKKIMHEVPLEQSWDYHSHRIVSAEFRGSTIIEGEPLTEMAHGLEVATVREAAGLLAGCRDILRTMIDQGAGANKDHVSLHARIVATLDELREQGVKHD